MGWTITFPPGSPQPGQEVCVTISGGGSSEPHVTVSFDGDSPMEIEEIKNLGSGVFIVCFTMPPNAEYGKISVSSKGGGFGTQYF